MITRISWNIQLLLILTYDAKIYGFCLRRRYHYDVIRIVTFIPETPKLYCICFLATLETPHDSIFGETSAKRANNFQNAQGISTSDTCKQHLPEAKVGSRILRRTQKKDFPGWVHIMKTNYSYCHCLLSIMVSNRSLYFRDKTKTVKVF